jgi:hypothetical protein
VDAFLTVARTAVGQPWCAALVTWCFVRAGCDPYAETVQHGVPEPASVASWAKWARATNCWVHTPRRGRLFVILGKGKSHIGFVVRDNGNGTFDTIEGNSNDEGSREGFEVCRRTRSVASVSGFIDVRGMA